MTTITREQARLISKSPVYLCYDSDEAGIKACERAAEIFKDGEWGVHIAIQHSYQPYHENHLGQYYLSLYQPWMMGANMIYEEDCLFNMFKEERQAWDDALTKGKRDMTRYFFKFVNFIKIIYIQN